MRRRTFLLGGIAATGLAGGAVVAARARDRFDGATIAPADALARARAGDLLLVDVRRPDEWAATGVPEGGHPLDMRRDDFEAALLALAAGDRDRAVALICARGVRSDRVAARLAAVGFTRVLDVSEGMLGSRAGPGWVARGLPTVRP